MRWCASVLLVALHFGLLHGQVPTPPESPPRAAIGAGMGVEYMTASDLVGLINATAVPNERVAQFKSAVEFFGAASVPVSDRWIIKIEYADLITSFSPMGAYGPTQFDVNIQMPSLIAQYVLTDRGVYNFKLGAGAGYHFGKLSERYFTLNDSFTGKGLGTVLELEGNTAFGDHLYAFLGANMRWDFIGTLTNGAGISPGPGPSGTGVTLHFFAAGARLGLTYLF